MGPMVADGDIPLTELMTAEELAAMGEEALPPQIPLEFDTNLALLVDEKELGRLGQRVVEMVEKDIESCSDWDERFARGLELIGLKNWNWRTSDGEDTEPFEGASTVIHPMLAEAGVRSQALAVEELLPASGPAKAQVMGKETKEKRAAADRVQEHMNYQLTVEDEVYFLETNQLHLYLPWFGSAYRKAYHDPIEDRNVLRFVRGEDIILPYRASSLAAARRVTHRFFLTDNDLKKYQYFGEYLDVDLGEPPEAETTKSQEALDDIDDKEPSVDDDDDEFEIYETDIYLDLPGFEDEDEMGPTGVALPYTITVEKSTAKILSIRRCWRQDDPLKKRRTRYSEYQYLPGIGSKGMGLIHFIGGLQIASTDSLRAFLDSCIAANLQGGFKAKDSGIKGGSVSVRFGEWQDIDASADELSKAFYTPPWKEPSAALFQVLGLLTDLGRRFASTMDMQVGEANNKAPVGTTIALLEQGQKVYSGVHKRGHYAVGVELRMLYELNGEHVPEDGYKYEVPGEEHEVFRKDYSPKLTGIVPVSDPNIFSQTQRIAQGEAQYRLAMENPQDFKKHEVLRRYLQALKVPDIDEVLIDPTDIQQMDPVSENIAIVAQRPVKAHDGENHQAHLAVHMAFFQHPQFGGNPQAQQLIGPAMIAHIAEHVALLYADRQRELGVPVPPINLGGDVGTPIVDPEYAQYSEIIAERAAMVVDQFMQQSGLFVPPADAAADAAAAEAPTELEEADIAAGAIQKYTAALVNLAKVKQQAQQAASDLAGLDETVGEQGGAPPAQPSAGPPQA